MKREIIATGATVQEALANAKAALGAGELDDVQYEVVEMEKKGFLGFGSRLAKVKAWVEVPDAPKREPRTRNKGPKPEDFVAPAEPAAPREPMTPESEIKLTPVEVSEGEDMSYDFICRLLSNLGIRAEATLYSRDAGGRQICITGEDASILIGRHGETLDALQHLSNLACAKKNIHGERVRDHVTVDIEGYRAKREEALRALARRKAAAVLKNGRNIALEPMNAYERRIIHSEIQSIAGVSTNSVGSENNRRVVIYPVKEDAQEATPAENV